MPVRVLFQFLLLVIATPVTALEFSAQAVMSTPGRADITTQLYYASGRMRKEFYYYGEPVIQILDANRHTSLMCFTDQQLCYENKTLEEINIGIEKRITSPCENNPVLQCQNEGEHAHNNRTVIKWKITSKDQKGQDKTSELWLDKELNIPVKQVLLNGVIIELKWLASEKLGNRDTEKWFQQIKLPDGETQESFQWFDKQLKISIREAFDNGNTQELKHIVVENLPDNLFTMPVGFDKRTVKSPQNPSKMIKTK